MPFPSRLLGTAALLLAVTGSSDRVVAQAEPIVRVTFRAGANTSSPTAAAWLCESLLPHRPEWPRGLERGAAFRLQLSGTELRIAASELPLPAQTLAAGSVQFGDKAPSLFSLADDGVEDWFVPAGCVPPERFTRLLRELEIDRLDQPRTFDAAVLAGHLAGPCVDGDPASELVRLAAMSGEVTFTAWQTDRYLRVRGRSEGGLLLPTLLIMALSPKTAANGDGLPLRAFGARDGDRGEAIRQLARSDQRNATRTLRSLLLAEDELRLSAIDTLVRRRASDELPRIVAAASPATPLATKAAIDALQTLWSDASPAARQRTRAALAHSTAPDLRRIDPQQLPGSSPTVEVLPPETSDQRARILLVMFLAGVALYGLWLRERTRLHGSLA